MTISDLNPLQFWLTPVTPYADIDDVISLSDFAITFNSEDKDSAVQYKPYFHILKSSDGFPVEIVVDDDSHAYKLSGRYQDGTNWQAFDFVQIDSGSHFRLTVDLSLYPAIAEKKIFFVVVDTTDLNILALTDHHSVKTEVSKSVLITYSNDSEYHNVLEGFDMKLRVPGVFVFGVFPEETETDDLSDGSVVSLRGSVKTQRLLNIEPVPDFLHKKIKYLLKCSDISIKGLNWKQEEGYEVIDIHPMCELRRGKVLLTQDGSVISNVYAP